MGTRDSGLNSGSFYSFEPAVRPSGPRWMMLEFILKKFRIEHEFLREDDGKVSIIFYDGERESVERACERIQRFG